MLDKAALQELFASQAPFDILISAATGGDRAMGPFLEMDMDGYAASFDKLWGYANVVRFGTEYLPPDGCIVLVSGTPAKRAKPGQISLASVGASVEHLVRTSDFKHSTECSLATLTIVACARRPCVDSHCCSRAGATTH